MNTDFGTPAHRPDSWPGPAVSSGLRGDSEAPAQHGEIAPPFVASRAHDTRPFAAHSGAAELEPGIGLTTTETAEDDDIIDIADIIDESPENDVFADIADMIAEEGDRPQTVDVPAPAAPRSEASATAEPLPDWMSWIDEAEEPATEPSPVLEEPAVAESPAVAETPTFAEPQAFTAPEVTTEPEALAAPVEPAGSEAEVEPITASRTPGAQPSSGAEDALASSLGEVADRLERIASSLRGRSAADLLAGSDTADPLELLITGFVLGYSQRPRA